MVITVIEMVKEGLGYIETHLLLYPVKLIFLHVLLQRYYSLGNLFCRARGVYYLSTNAKKPYAKGFPGGRRPPVKVANTRS
jgi:hypothetical protein